MEATCQHTSMEPRVTGSQYSAADLGVGAIAFVCVTIANQQAVSSEVGIQPWWVPSGAC